MKRKFIMSLVGLGAQGMPMEISLTPYRESDFLLLQ
jgi:hypothetical protein